MMLEIKYIVKENGFQGSLQYNEYFEPYYDSKETALKSINEFYKSVPSDDFRRLATFVIQEEINCSDIDDVDLNDYFSNKFW